MMEWEIISRSRLIIIKENSQFSTNENAYFILNSVVDFSINTAASPEKRKYILAIQMNPIIFLIN